MSIMAFCHDKHEQSAKYLNEGIEMGKSMGLFGVRKDASAQLWLNDDVDWIRAASHTAWGVFNWTTSVPNERCH